MLMDFWKDLVSARPCKSEQYGEKYSLERHIRNPLICP